MTGDTGPQTTNLNTRIRPQGVGSASTEATATRGAGLGPDESKRLVWWAAALAVWSTLYALAHVYWAAGGHAGFSLLKPAATELATWQEINAMASVVLMVPVGVAVGLTLSGQRPRVRRTLPAGCLIGASIAASHGAFGIVYRILNVASVVDIDGRAFEPSTDGWVVWDLVLFEPWFLIEGILFAGTGWAALTTDRDQRRWLTACAFGATAATIIGLLGVRLG